MLPWRPQTPLLEANMALKPIEKVLYSRRIRLMDKDNDTVYRIVTSTRDVDPKYKELH
jgi:hypothetical protein